jgi:hypothetical protein
MHAAGLEGLQGTHSISLSQTDASIFSDLIPRYTEVSYQAVGSDQSKSLLHNLHSHINAFGCFVPTDSILKLDFMPVHSWKLFKPPYLLKIFDMLWNGVAEILKYLT